MVDFPARYESLRGLGTGGMGQVFLVRDNARGEDVALKLFSPTAGQEGARGPAFSDEARFLFKQEFWALASLSHPNLVAAYDYGELADGTPYFTMEHVPGVDLAPGALQGEASLKTWLPGVIAALGYLHSRGFLHGDLKPENIRVLPDGSARLIDLGLLTRVGDSGGPVRGSLNYLAPECIRQGAVDGRADLYALGAVIHHLVAGKPPFSADGPLQMLRAHLLDKPTPLRELVHGLSITLEAAVLRLLAKEPSARYATAGELARALGLPRADEAGTLLAPPIIGRAPIQADLADLLAARMGVVKVLVGPAGSGKSRLLRELRADAQLAGVRVLAARGLGVEAAPYEALMPWFRALAAEAPASAVRLAPVLVKILPGIGATWDLTDLAPAPSLEGPAERLRLEAAIAELAVARAPVALWILDDADRLDSASRALIAFLRHTQRTPGVAWSWLDATATGVLETSSVTLAPLDDFETLDVARAMLGQHDLPQALLERLPLLAVGLPGAIEAMLGHWTRVGTLRRDGDSWVAAAGADFDLPGGLAVVLDERFESLSDTAKQVARVAALLGDEGLLPLLASVSGVREGDFFAALDALALAEVLSFDGSTFRFLASAAEPERAWSARARRLAASWDAEAAYPIHQAAATWLAAEGPPEDPTRPLAASLAIARHLLSAAAMEGGPGAAAVAAPWAQIAARRAIGLGEPARAGTLLDRALALPGLDDADRLSIQRCRADALRLEGRIDEAVALAESAVLPEMRTHHDAEIAHELASYGLLCQMKGRYDDARAALDEAASLADARGDRATAVRARVSAGRVAYFAGEGDEARQLLARAVEDARAARLTTMLASALGLHGYLIGAGDATRLPEALAILEEAVTVNQAIRDAVEELEALTLRGTLVQSAGRFAEAEAAFKAALSIGERLGLANETLFARLNLGAVALERGHIPEARVHGHAAMLAARQQGRKFPESFGLAVEGLARVFAGDLAEGLRTIEGGLALSREIGNRYVELAIAVHRTEALLELGRATSGLAALVDARTLAQATGNDEHQARLARLALAFAVLGGVVDAPAVLANGIEEARQLGQTAGLAHALRWQATWLVSHGRASEAMPTLLEARELALGAGLDGLVASIDEIEGRAYAALGELEKAASRFEAGLMRAEGLGLRALTLVCQAALANVDASVGELAAASASALEALLEPLEPAERAAYMASPERAAIVGAGHHRVSATPARHQLLAELVESIRGDGGLAAVMHRAIAALATLADAERGFVFLYNGAEFTEQAFYGMAADEADAYSTGLAFKALWSDTPIWVEDAQADAEFGDRLSVQALDLRSVLGVPLIQEGRAIGVMLTDSRRVNAHFGPGDMALAEALAKTATAAIGEARRLADLERRVHELEIVARAASAIVGLQTLGGAFAAVAAEALLASGAERALLLLGPNLEIAAGCHRDGQVLDVAQQHASASAGRWVFDRGEPLHLLDAQDDEIFANAQSVMALGLQTIVAAPISHAGERLGVLYLDDRRLAERDTAVLGVLVRLGELLGAFLVRNGVTPLATPRPPG
jgi:GAF domain-containing protein